VFFLCEFSRTERSFATWAWCGRCWIQIRRDAVALNANCLKTAYVMCKLSENCLCHAITTKFSTRNGCAKRSLRDLFACLFKFLFISESIAKGWAGPEGCWRGSQWCASWWRRSSFLGKKNYTYSAIRHLFLQMLIMICSCSDQFFFLLCVFFFCKFCSQFVAVFFNLLFRTVGLRVVAGVGYLQRRADGWYAVKLFAALAAGFAWLAAWAGWGGLRKWRRRDRSRTIRFLRQRQSQDDQNSSDFFLNN